MVARAALLLALSAAVAVMVSVVSATEAYAQDMSAQLEEFNSECFDSAGEFEPTDGCYEYAESLGLEIDNINESMDKGCVLSDMYEDYSCKGPSAPSSSSVSEQGATSIATEDVKGCFTVDSNDLDTVGKQVFTLVGLHGDPSDSAEQLYSPDCFNGKAVSELDSRLVDALRSDPCYDVVSEERAIDAAHVEYVGCPEQDSVDDRAYRPITQQGTLAPEDWREHLVPVKPASYVSGSPKSNSIKPAETKALSSKNPLVKEHQDSDTGRSQGQALSSSKRSEIHAKYKEAKSKLDKQEKASKASKKAKKS